MAKLQELVEVKMSETSQRIVFEYLFSPAAARIRLTHCD